jgi:hypothetical protein
MDYWRKIRAITQSANADKDISNRSKRIREIKETEYLLTVQDM